MRHHRPRRLLLAAAVVAVLAGAGLSQAEPFAWQEHYATVLPTGDLEWKPEPFAFEAIGDVRYVDFDNGDDANDGRSKDAAWKHHPWDPAATANAKAGGNADTFVFRRGVVYRGVLAPAEASDVRLTSDPTWGEGEAMLAGSERVGGWQKLGQHDEIPDADKVWYVDLDFAPRNVWVVGDDETTRLPLARMPNWTEGPDDDIKQDWWTFESDRKRGEVDGVEMQMPIDEQLDLPEEAVLGAYVWNEYGWVMGTPYPTRVVHYDRSKGEIAVGGQWGTSAGGHQIVPNMRYYLEDKPQFLDDPNGEFWFDKQGDGGRLYARLPGDADPNSVRVEVAKDSTLIDLKEAENVVISGLAFRWTNTYFELDAVLGNGPRTEPAAIRWLGEGEGLTVANCTFTDVNKAVRVVAMGDNATIDGVVVRDNDLLRTDHSGVDLYDGSDWGQEYPTTRLLGVEVLRNRLRDIGRRPTRYGQGHAIDILCAETVHVAGNVLDRCYGAGIFVYGAKRSAAKTDRPLSRIVIHENKVTNPMLNNNDWGGIETWQGGPAYVFNNVSGNPGGFKLWSHLNEPNNPAASRFGHAYYMDGGFKQYYFNNVAWGQDNDPFSATGNTAAFQEIHGYLASVFNNTAYNFVVGSRRQAPVAGRNKYMGNIWQSIGYLGFRHADPSNIKADPNKADAGEVKSEYEHSTNAYVANLFSDPPEQIAVFEPDGSWYGTLADFAKALARRGSIGDVGEIVDGSLLADAEQHDFRPTAAAKDKGVKVFVPWSLHATVGEWHFYHAGDDERLVPDEGFHLAPYYVKREDYHDNPRYPLQVVGNADFVDGPLEDWTAGALAFDGTTHAVVPAEAMAATLKTETKVRLERPKSDWATISTPDKVEIGATIPIKIELASNVPAGQQLKVDTHYVKADGSMGGFSSYGGEAKPVDGPGPYSFGVTAKEHADLGKWTVVAYLSPDGTWEKKTNVAYYDVGVAAKAAPAEGYRSPRVDDTNFLVELYFKADAADGTLISNIADGRGYAVTLDDGRPKLTVATPDDRFEVAGNASLADGSWHHVIAEVDREARTMQLYVDGTADASASGPGGVSISNNAPIYVGGGADLTPFVGEMEFARVALGTLADAKTTIEELYAWQFDGPFLRDFASRKANGKRDAGALEETGYGG